MSARPAALALARAAGALPPGAGWALCGLVAAGGWLALPALAPVGDHGHPVCALRRIAHIGCPTCGLTRALIALARGDLSASLALHPMAVALVAQLAAGWALWGLAITLRPRLAPGSWIPWIVAANAGAFFVIWIVRLLAGTLPA